MSTLTDDELGRIKAELLDHVMDLGAEPYFGYTSLYAVIRDHVASSDTAATTSSTAVSAATVAAGVGTTITVASASGLAVGYRVVLDCDDNEETCTIKSLSGAVVGLNPRKPHGGTYRVEIESPLTIVRGILARLTKLADQRSAAVDGAGVKRVDEVEFFGPSDGRSQLDEIAREQARLRFELASAVGLRRVLAAAGVGANRFEVY